jgi:hypothetical protein
VLDPGQDQHRADEVERLSGDEQPAERHTRGGALGRHTDREVAEEHQRDPGGNGSNTRCDRWKWMTSF